jgi:hypothetical protein
VVIDHALVDTGAVDHGLNPRALGPVERELRRGGVQESLAGVGHLQ